MITVLFILGIIGAYSVYKPFMLSITVAILLAMATFNFSKKLFSLTHSSRLSATVATSLLTLLLFAPIIYLSTIGVGYLSKLDNAGITETIHTVKTYIDGVPFLKNLSEQYLNDTQISNYIRQSTHYVTAAGGAGLGFVKNMLFMVIFYFFINFYRNQFFDMIVKLLPVSKEKGIKMISEVAGTMEVVFYSIIVTAIFEGFLFGLIMGYFGFNGLFFGLIYGFASLIPVIGGLIVWVPVSLYVWTQIDHHTAIVIATYSVVVISIIADTFIKPVIIDIMKKELFKSTLQINSIVIFFSIFAGMSSYGFWGMILGPAITSFLIAITKVYLDYSEK